MAHLLASRPACATSAVSPSICTTASPRRGFLFGDGGSSSIARACHHCRALVTPAARPGRRRVTTGNDRNRNSNSLTTIILIPTLLRASLGQAPSACIPRRFLPDWLRGQGWRASPFVPPLADRLHGFQWRQGFAPSGPCPRCAAGRSSQPGPLRALDRPPLIPLERPEMGLRRVFLPNPCGWCHQAQKRRYGLF
ncbi:hypothetical protein J2T32_003351 [Kerstersia gyiorum]|nr:hypothetical protein [Kerstersia gyiorum]MCP1719681.1 hypothetical protein [Kerstersia gyiorum]MCW2188422.1 hypothetical protein [Kerstersia gyiorum]